MNKRIQRLLIRAERRLRILLYGFCVYSTIYAIVFNMLSEYADTIVHHYIFIILASVFSFFASLVVDEEIETTKKINEWDWKPENRVDYICTEFVGLVSIGAFYFAVQMGLCMIFFPGTVQIKIGEHYVYPYLFTFNSIMVYILYRLTIIRIKLTKPEQE